MSMIRLLTVAGAALFGLALAPAPASLPPFDAALALREDARSAAAAGEWDRARSATRNALVLQPGHPGLLANLARIEAARLEAGLDHALFAALETAAEAGIALDLSELEAPLATLRAEDPGRLQAVVAALAANAAPVGEARVHFTADRPDALVEALASDIETERVYLGAVAPRAVLLAEPFEGGATSVFAAPEAVGSVFGLAVDRTHRLLYAATGSVPQTPPGPDGEKPGAALVSWDLSTGELAALRPVEGAARLGDLVVRDGAVLATEPGAKRIWRLSGPAGRFEPFFEDPRFADLQGVAVSRGAVFVADYALGLWRVDPARRTAERVVSDGESLIGLDGLAAGPGGALYAVRNGSEPAAVLKITPRRDGPAEVEVVLRGHPAMGEPTQIRIADGRAFLIADAAWARFPADGGEPAPGTPPVVLTFPVD